MYLFDSSSLVNLVKRGIVKPFVEGVTLDLAIYESINAVWKEYMLLKRIDEETALRFVSIISRVFEVMEVTSMSGLESEVFKLASKENLTVYDASYLYVSVGRKLTLVTDDWKLRSIASKYTRVLASGDLT
jgi:predicted nucleic acid-binding protein